MDFIIRFLTKQGVCHDSTSFNRQYVDEILGEITLNVSQITVMKKSGTEKEEDDDEEVNQQKRIWALRKLSFFKISSGLLYGGIK